MTDKEKAEHQRLLDRWAEGRASKAQILRCMELDRKAARDVPPKDEYPLGYMQGRGAA